MVGGRKLEDRDRPDADDHVADGEGGGEEWQVFASGSKQEAASQNNNQQILQAFDGFSYKDQQTQELI